MKQYFFVTFLTVLICQPCFSSQTTETNQTPQQITVDELFRNFSKEKHTTHVKIGSFLMTLTNIFTDTKGVNHVEVFAFDECEQSVKDKFNAAINQLKDNTFETLVSTSENGERTKVLIKIKDNFISEIVVLSGGNDPALVRIKGKIKPEDVTDIAKKNK